MAVLDQNSSKLDSFIYNDCSYVDFESRNFFMAIIRTVSVKRIWLFQLLIPILLVYLGLLLRVAYVLKKFLYVTIASVGMYACFGTWLALMYQLIEVIIGLDN